MTLTFRTFNVVVHLKDGTKRDLEFQAHTAEEAAFYAEDLVLFECEDFDKIESVTEQKGYFDE